MSVDSSTTLKTFPLFLIPHQYNEDINYMRHTLKEWDIGKLKDPIYFYQPTVKPNSEGGVVKETNNATRNKRPFYDVKKEFIKRPEDENWMMYTSDGVLFKGSPDTLSSAAVIIPGKDEFIIQLVNNSIRIKDGKDIDGDIDIDTVVKRSKAEKEMKQRNFKKNFRFMYDDLEKKENERISKAKEMRENGDEDIALGGSGDESGGDDAYNLDENAADVDDARSDDDEDVGDAIDDMFADMPEDLVEMGISDDEEESVSSSDDEDEEGKSGKKKKKKKGDQAKAEKASVSSQGENQGQSVANLSTEKIVDDILGPQVLKEDELVRYMMDVGYVTSKELFRKFQDRLQTPEQRNAFKDLAKKRLQTYIDKGMKYFKLKLKR
ncbi:hypothetical protein M9Y10_025672 [Tritrichomonas musculus]|uniref:Transcription initiation factor IIF subunit alpha n=1 Tax=Tritrichomonas musculus TaxID=1915356 RepID=A0ABR2HA77_9EUKA